jgi:ABC-2 type transport system permease protein
MKSLNNIIRKEMKELLTPATILPIVVMAFIFGSIGTSMEGIQEELKEKPVIGYIVQDTGDLAALAVSIMDNNSEVVFNSTNIEDKTEGLEKIGESNGLALILIKQNFSENIHNNKQGEIEVYWIMKGAGIMDSISSEAAGYLINSINYQISKSLIEENATVNATIALNPSNKIDTTYFKGKELNRLSPGAIIGLLSSQSFLIPIVMMMIIIVAGNMVISSMAMEKENKTLETLLTLPVKRTSIVTGKIVASAVVGLIFAIIYMVGMSRYFAGFNFSGQQLNLADFGLALTTDDFVLMGISLFVALISALALCMLLGTLAKNYKSAQTLTFPITMLALVPMFFTMFADFDTLPLALKALVFAIPFSHPMMAARALIFNDYLLVVSGIVYVAIFAIVTISIVVWVFKTDKLLTGSTRLKKFGDLWKRYKR